MTDFNLSDLNRLNAEHTNNLKSRYFKALDDYFAGDIELLAKHARAGTSVVLNIPQEILWAVFGKDRFTLSNSKKLSQTVNHLTSTYFTQQGFYHKVDFEFKMRGYDDLLIRLVQIFGFFGITMFALYRMNLFWFLVYLGVSIIFVFWLTHCLYSLKFSFTVCFDFSILP